jgi:carboxyl-terminal processing protease
MNRERLAWLVSVVLLAILAFQLPGSLAQRDDDFAWVRTLEEVHRQILQNYVDPVDDSSLKQHAIDGMLGTLDDPFTDYIPPEKQEEFDKVIGGSFSGVGISLRDDNGKMLVMTPIDGGPADKAGIDAGDLIVQVDHKSIEKLPIDEVVKRVSGPIGSPVTLTVDRGGKLMDFTMKRDTITLPTVTGYQRNADESWSYYVSDKPKVAFLRISQFDDNTFDELHKALAGEDGHGGLLADGMQGLILDLRFNPGGQLQQAVKVVNLFLKEGVIVSTHGRNSPEEIERANGESTLPFFPMIVLVNDRSASAAEIVSGSLQDNHRSLVLGQRTFGKGSVQRVLQLGDDGTLKMTIAHWYLPSGRLVSRKKDSTDWGVDPQIVVTMSDEAENDLEDLLERREAIRYHTPDIASTEPSTTEPSTRPTTQPTDPQFEQALNTIVGLIILDSNKGSVALPRAAAPTTRPILTP